MWRVGKTGILGASAVCGDFIWIGRGGIGGLAVRDGGFALVGIWRCFFWLGCGYLLGCGDPLGCGNPLNCSQPYPITTGSSSHTQTQYQPQRW